MKTNSVKGTFDYLPKEALIRDYLQDQILKTYRSCGFERIITPILEDIENLDKSEGGENLNLLFKILKRGEKLTEAIESGNPKDLTDMGLRYDLTLPLSRYYANNRANLATPFKVIQIDQVFRAERPQKGRLREFMQCDIDILGSSSNSCEIELIDTTAKALLNIGIKNFKIRINDRRILKNIILSAGFTDADIESVSVTFDKMDKIGAEGVKEELLAKEFDAVVVDKFISIISITPFTLEEASKYCEDKSAIENVREIIAAVNEISDGKYGIEYDRSLVRGQGYYTGTIFEIESLDFGSSIGGGGRYDNMIGKFIGENVPAVGFSIGFERIFSILKDKNFTVPDGRPRLAVIYPAGEVTKAIKLADTYRGEYDVTLYEKPKKIGKLFNKLEESGYYGCIITDEASEIKVLQK